LRRADIMDDWLQGGLAAAGTAAFRQRINGSAQIP
jgi:hypothetical protein